MGTAPNGFVPIAAENLTATGSTAITALRCIATKNPLNVASVGNVCHPSPFLLPTKDFIQAQDRMSVISAASGTWLRLA